MFDTSVYSWTLQETAMVLFLNKMDLFEAKIARNPLVNYFETYDGPDDGVEESATFIQNLFLAQNQR